MGIMQIIYSSRPFGFDTAMLNGILSAARRCNQRDDVTGALICRRDIYLQMLEGPEKEVLATLERIKRDDRHLNISLRFCEPVPERMFANWDMLHDPARSWLWSEAEISGGALERASSAEIRSVFSKLADRMAAQPPAA